MSKKELIASLFGPVQTVDKSFYRWNIFEDVYLYMWDEVIEDYWRDIYPNEIFFRILRGKAVLTDFNVIEFISLEEVLERAPEDILDKLICILDLT